MSKPFSSADVTRFTTLVKTEIDAGAVRGKIDWGNVLKIFMEFLPLILAFFERDPAAE
jgi:hypothetical protein